MKKFINKSLIIVSPFVAAIILLIFIDAYKVFRSYDNYYKDSFIELNREMVTTRTYIENRENEKFNSFILGSSRSQAFKCEEWTKYIDNNSKPFHFDAHGEGIYGIAKKIEYISSLGDSISNALIIVDRTILSVTNNRNEKHLSISPPELSGESKLEYYYIFLEAQINYKFLITFIDYSFFGKYKTYMEGFILDDKYPNKTNKVNCDIWLVNDDYIKNDSLGYYNRLNNLGVFYERPKANYQICEITKEEISYLKSIMSIFNSHKTNYKIIISPNYDQIPLEKEQIGMLIEIFGKNNVFNFSGKNKFTDSISNYYEDSHFRTSVANEILEIIY